MYEVSVQGSFCATHRVARPDGSLEPLHGHDWQVTAVWRGPQLNEHGLLIDFERARATLHQLLGELNHTALNDHPWLAGAPASAERVARVLFERLDAALKTGNDFLRSVTVVEAPGCSATYMRS